MSFLHVCQNPISFWVEARVISFDFPARRLELKGYELENCEADRGICWFLAVFECILIQNLQ